MQRAVGSSLAALALLLGACATQEDPANDNSGEKASAAVAVDYMSVANRLVARNLGVAAGDFVLITGTPPDQELLEDIATEVRKAGGWPLISVFSDRLAKLSFDAVPPERDADKPELELELAKLFTAQIVVEGPTDQGNLRHVPPARVAARAQAAEATSAEAARLNRRIVFLGNGMFPSEENARLNGMAQADFARLFWDGVNVDPAAMAATGEVVRATLHTGKSVRVTDARGTDITFALAGHPPYFSDGAITEEDRQLGPQGQTVWLPAGEVYVRVAPGSANGTIAAERQIWEGEVIEGLKLEVKNGRVISMTAASGLDRLKAQYDASAAGKDAVSIVDIGVNTAMSVPPGSKLLSFVPAGMVTLFIGGDVWAGGTNTAPGFPVFLKGVTVAVDGTPLVQDGVLRTQRPAA